MCMSCVTYAFSVYYTYYNWKMCVWSRMRERERDRETDKQRETERERDRDREIRKIVNPLIYIHYASYKIAHIMKIHNGNTYMYRSEIPMMFDFFLSLTGDLSRLINLWLLPRFYERSSNFRIMHRSIYFFNLHYTYSFTFFFW